MGIGQSKKKKRRTVDISAPKLNVSSSEGMSSAEKAGNRISRLPTSQMPTDNGCDQVDSQVMGWHEDQNNYARPNSSSVPESNTSVDHYFHKVGVLSKEDISTVVLRQTVKASDGSALARQNSGKSASQLPLPMLVQIKGRRNVQVRLVECTIKSLNDGDVFLLITETELFQFIGKSSNGFERAKSGELASRILGGKEMGCRTSSVITLEYQSAEQQAGNISHFMKLLGGTSNSQIAVASSAVNDEDFEQHCINSCVVYAVEEHQQKLIPLTEWCGKILEHSMLSPTDVFVFDFYSEVYVWVGSHSSRQIRQQGIHQASELFRLGYLEPKAFAKRGSIFLSNWISGSRQARPRWALLTRATDGAEPFLFKEKFIDWPGTGRPFTPLQATFSNISQQPIQLQPCNVVEMRRRTTSPPILTVSGKNLGRGLGIPSSDYNGGYLVTTTSLTIWNIQEFSYHTVPENKRGIFYSDEAYVVRWSYSVTRNHASHTRSSSFLGPGNCCYFFWLGKNCTVTEQGATAMLTVELDKEKGPQIRVVQGKEPPAFLQLFGGGMIICPEQPSSQKPNRMFYVGGEMQREAYLVEIPVPSSMALRSRGCFVITAANRHELYVWCGCQASESSLSVAMTAAQRLVERFSFEGCSDMKLLSVSEGYEDQKFWRTLGGKQDYYSLLQEPKFEAFSPRMFLLSRASGKFAAEEILSPSRLPDGTCIFPFLQSDLYDAPQPALFLLDAQHCVYLWCGWWPVKEDGKPAASTGMAADHWVKDKELGMKTATDYAKCTNYTFGFL
jgi:supervillin